MLRLIQGLGAVILKDLIEVSGLGWEEVLSQLEELISRGEIEVFRSSVGTNIYRVPMPKKSVQSEKVEKVIIPATKTKPEEVRKVVKAIHELSGEWTINQVNKELKREGVNFSAEKLRGIIGHLTEIGEIEVTGTRINNYKKPFNLYQMKKSEEYPEAVRIVTQLESFSLERFAEEYGESAEESRKVLDHLVKEKVVKRTKTGWRAS